MHLTFFLLNNLSGQITFSEIMYDVATNEYHDEFVEIFNLSSKDSADLTGYRISDGAGMDKLLSFNGGLRLAPRSFAIILDGSYPANSDTYDQIIPDSVLILIISDNSFGKNGLSNTVAESLTLYDSSGIIVSSYTYSSGNLPGYSDEKINLDGPNESANWSESKRSGGTPGWYNSVSPLSYDFGFDENSLSIPDPLFSGETAEILIQIYDFGIYTASDSMKLFIYSDMNQDSTYQSDEELIYRDNIVTNAQMIVFEWKDIPVGKINILIELIWEKDQNPENNYLAKSIEVLKRGGNLNINEIKFLSSDDEPEWLELYNYGNEDIYLKNWSIADLRDTAVIDTTMHIYPSQFIVLAKEKLPQKYSLSKDHLIIMQNFLTFNNQSDEIRLMSPGGEVIETIPYDSEWLEGEEFRFPSLEKINPVLAGNIRENWGPSVNSINGTPGRPNSIYSALNVSAGDVSASPNPFSPDGDGIDDVTLINGQVSESSGRIRAWVYDIKGRQIRILTENSFTGSQFHFVWDGKNDAGYLARIGIYIIYIQILNDRRGSLHEMKLAVVLAQKL
jgi:hypothetical protein